MYDLLLKVVYSIKLILFAVYNLLIYLIRYWEFFDQKPFSLYEGILQIQFIHYDPHQHHPLLLLLLLLSYKDLMISMAILILQYRYFLRVNYHTKMKFIPDPSSSSSLKYFLSFYSSKSVKSINLAFPCNLSQFQLTESA